MVLQVQDEVIKEAKNCQQDFSCLKSDGEGLCKVKSCVGGEVHFIECMNDEYCSYQSTFANEAICDCPVRIEIYNRYGI